MRQACTAGMVSRHLRDANTTAKEFHIVAGMGNRGHRVAR